MQSNIIVTAVVVIYLLVMLLIGYLRRLNPTQTSLLPEDDSDRF
jgi:hypothetical protein